MLDAAAKQADSQQLSHVLTSSVCLDRDSVNAALVEAVAKGNFECCQLLISKGACGNAANRREESVLRTAVRLDYMTIVKLLLESGSNTYKLILHQLISNHSDASILRLAVEKGASVNAQNKDGKTALILAVKSRHHGAVSALVDLGADVNLQDNTGQTALHLAACKGFSVSQLLKAKPDLNIQDEDGNTALILAACEGLCRVVYALCEAGCNVNIENNKGSTALYILSMKGHLECVEILVKHGADIFTDREGMIPINWAITYGRHNVVCYFLQAISDYSCIEKITPIDPMLQAIMLGQEQIINAFLELGLYKGQDDITDSFRGLFVLSSTENLSTKMKERLSQASAHPPTLKQLSRLAVRKAMPHVKIMVDSFHLPIPLTLQEYVSLRYLSKII